MIAALILAILAAGRLPNRLSRPGSKEGDEALLGARPQDAVLTGPNPAT